MQPLTAEFLELPSPISITSVDEELLYEEHVARVSLQQHLYDLHLLYLLDDDVVFEEDEEGNQTDDENFTIMSNSL